MELQSCVQFLIENGYMAVIKGKYIVTAKFNKAVTGKDTGLVLLSNNVPAVKEAMLPNKEITFESLYMQFIREAQVPARLLNGQGNPYDANKYSDMGMKAFKKALEVDKVDYQILVRSTFLYYKSSSGYKKAITNYMCEGTWKSDYLLLEESIKSGTVKDHVDQQTKSNEYTRFKLG